MIRSLLYVPGDREDRVTKAFAAGPDAVLVDLEDAVAPSAKDAARDVVRQVLRRSRDRSPELWVRINTSDAGRADMAALLPQPEGLAGLVLAKCEDPGWLDEVSALFPSDVALAPLIESALAIRRLDALCSHPRVTQCHLGEIDLLADLGARPDSGGLLDHARYQLVYASAAAGILPPIGGVFTAVQDTEALAQDCAALASMGFAGRPALHPIQVPVINAAFRPSADELAAATNLVAFYEETLRRGQGVVRDDEGRMIDEAVVRRARWLVADPSNASLPPRRVEP